jgi:phosphate-selective porin OprO/OprP
MNALLALVILAGSSAGAQDKPAEPPAPAPVATPSPAPAPAQHTAPASASAEGFLIQSEDGAYRLQLRAYTHFDGRFQPGDGEGRAVDTFLLRRVRPILQGTVARHFEFNLTPDFGGGTTTLQDAFLDVRYSPKARLRVGKFKAPLSLERLQSATAIAFVERALPSALVPNRDVGVQVLGELGGGVLTYAAAVLNGAPDGGSVDLDASDGKEWVGRLFVSPFKGAPTPLRGLGLGIGGTTGVQAGPAPTYRSGGQVGIVTFAGGLTLDGRRTRYAPQLSFLSGPFGLQAEFVRSESRVKTEEGLRATFEAHAWQATATLVLTGDAASFAGLRPARPFDPAQGHWGAVELAVRVNGLELGGEAFDAALVDPARTVREAFAWAVGVNWWLNRNVKQVVSFERTRFTGGAAVGDRPAENALFVRTQLSF